MHRIIPVPMQDAPSSHRRLPLQSLVGGTAALILAVAWAHGAAAILGGLTDASLEPIALPLTLAALGSTLLAMVAGGRLGTTIGTAAGALCSVGIAVAYATAGAAGVAIAVPAALAAGRWLAVRSSTRSVSVGWLLLSLIAVGQTARLATHITNPASPWSLTTSNPLWAEHECLPAYVYAAELSERGEANVYDADHYPGLNPAATPSTALVGITLEDPFQYPPQFLLLPRLAIAMTHDYATIRATWFALQITGFLWVGVLLSRWIGGAAGQKSLLLLPGVLAAFPTLHTLQYGQFHLAAIALGVLGMLMVTLKKDALGGVLIAAAILAKLFPAMLLVVLFAQRRWRALAWVAGWTAAASGLALAVLGPAPFEAFTFYHLPRLANGSAFAFGEAWPEIADLMVADNQGVPGLIAKLDFYGISVPGAAWVTPAYLMFVAVLAVLGTRRLDGAPRWAIAASWLGLLGLASQGSSGAFGDYVPVAAIWMLSLMIPALEGRPFKAALFALAAVFQLFLIGTAPVGDFVDPMWMMPLSAVGALSMVAISAWAAAAADVTDERSEVGLHQQPATQLGSPSCVP